MEVYTTEEQQVEAIKKWWRENKWSVIGGILIGIAALWGGRTWMAGQDAHKETASDIYQIMMAKMSSGELDEAAADGSALLGQFSDTPYAALASLALAKIKLEQGDTAAASSHLSWALNNAEQEEVKMVARLRLAELLLAQGDTAGALAQLNAAATPGAFEAIYEQLKGDILVAEGKPDQAREAYVRALAAMAPTSPGRRLLQMKIDDLGIGEESLS
ncbi:MAG TPA: tetratricopeptide repeat protein [Gammaproteobacteria bacterium]|nr:tetratricopeptide repeat protein [Gammaproteobacteria bacterium]